MKTPDSKAEGELASHDSNVGETHNVGEGQLHRRLDNRQIQLIAAGGSIGTALFISIGGSLAKGGPVNLLLAFTIYSLVLALVNNSAAEMNTYMPVAGGFIRHAGYWVDDALGFVAGWNFFLYEVFLIPFEITALTFVIAFWSEDATTPGVTAGICIAVSVVYALINVLAVEFYGEVEFWLSGGKIILVFILLAFTFITMVGGNPRHDAYGFDTSVTLEHSRRIFLMVTWAVGPEYISMISAEAKHPSVYVKAAFKTVYYRFCLFFFGSALAVGIVVAYNDPVLVETWLEGGDTSNAAASPYVIAMENLGITILPDIVNALIFTSIFSAGNTYVFCATRALYSLSLEGRAPRFLRSCNKKGLPIYCFYMVMLFPFLSLLQVANSSAVVLTWLSSIITGGILINFIIMSITFLNYYQACKVQGVDRKTRPYYGLFQPYCAYIALAIQTFILFGFGYTAFRPKWSVEVFFQNYSMQIVAVVFFIGWKFSKKTRYVRPNEVDLVWERPLVEEYERTTTEPILNLWTEMGRIVGIRKRKAHSAA